MRFCAEESQLTGEVGWYLDHLLGERGASPHTIAAYERDLLQAAAWLQELGTQSFLEVDGNVSAKLREKLGKQGYAVVTIQRKLSAIRSLVKFLARRAGSVPLHLPKMTGGRRPKRLPKALTEDEMQRLLEAPDTSQPLGLRDRAMIEMLYGGGLRVSELTGLRLEDYAASESQLRVNGKREKVRILPLPAETHDVFRTYLQAGRPRFVKKAATSHVFLNTRGGPISRSMVFRILRKYASLAGIEKVIGPHTLRHTYAVHLVKNGADLRVVQELLGHASIVTTEIYTHLDVDTVQKKYDKAHPRAKS